MPFIGQDWRSPGEVWIKTIEGWEPMKLLRKSHFVRHVVYQQQQQQREQQQRHEQQRQHYHHMDDCLPSSSSVSPSPNFDVDDHQTVDVELPPPPPKSSSSLSSSLDSNQSLQTDSDSENESILIGLNDNNNVIVVGGGDNHHLNHHRSSDPVPVPGKRDRHESGDSLTLATTTTTTTSSSSCCGSSSSLSNDSISEQQNADDNSGFTIADIIQRLQRSSSQPIPMDILKESSEQIEIYYQQPYYRITMNPTREVQGSNIISDAFYRLDFCNAIRDIRRFAYVSKLLHLLITQNLTSLSGNATKALFWMLEEIAKQVASNKQNIHVIRELLIELREIVDKYLCWGRPLGSTSLWEQHLRTMERICEMTDAIEITPPKPGDGKPSWSELPEELIREILLRLSDYKDLKRSAQACQRMNSLLNEEQHIWKQLVKYHFTKDQLRWSLRMISIDFNNQFEQINTNKTTNDKQKSTKMNINIEIDQNSDPIIDQNDDNDQKIIIDWERLFHLLRKKFGLKEEYADCLFLCRYCRCLFWKSKNHPCILENPDLTRQVLVTSPLTGFKSTHHNHHSTKYPSSSNNSQQQQPLAAILRSRSLAFNHANNSLNQRPPMIPPNVQQQQQNQLPNEPVIVQNLPFFEHPLVIQRQRQRNDQDQDQNQPNANEQNATAPTNRQQPQTTFQKAPLHVPITPQAFLKFFSL
ncbi:uncharacterized protein LOC113797049 isoform X1 [Dermatophagoides pteronyssinus]|uniref:uncharacterized protein LOC113797049 isoform X1 n=1 Tax=Dermatophagoides pteronyssinus TaxID=6956 RepID=UPI003F67FAE3